MLSRLEPLSVFLCLEFAPCTCDEWRSDPVSDPLSLFTWQRFLERDLRTSQSPDPDNRKAIEGYLSLFTWQRFLERDLRTPQSPDPDNRKAIEGAYPKDWVTSFSEKDLR